MFKKRASVSPSVNTVRSTATTREELMASNRARSPSIRTGPRARQSLPNAFAPSRHPAEQIGIDRLLVAYDDYPRLVGDLEATSAALDIAENDVERAESKRQQLERELQDERTWREADAKKAVKDREQAVKDAQTKVRDELNPKIKDLEEKLRVMTQDRDTNKRDLHETRMQAGKWADQMDKLHRERKTLEEQERRAAESRKTVGERLEELDNVILSGLRESASKA